MKSFKTPNGTELPILNLKGKDYLQVMHRIQWFREVHPDWRIDTEFTQLSDKHAITKATIRDQNGNAMASAHKREDAGHFPDFSEKSETGAIGRALALCGYGTQFCADEMDEGGRIVDSPAPSVKQNVHAAIANQPGHEDGDPHYHGPWKFKTGTFKHRTPEEVPVKELKKWIDYWDKQEVTGKSVTGALREDLDHAIEHITAIERMEIA